jgi:hypothetical protein
MKPAFGLDELVHQIDMATKALCDLLTRANDYRATPIDVEYLLTSKIFETLLEAGYTARAEHLNRMATGPLRKAVRKFFGSTRTDVAVLDGPFVRALIEVKIEVTTPAKVVADMKKIARTLRARHRGQPNPLGAVVFQTYVGHGKKPLSEAEALARASEIEAGLRDSLRSFADRHADFEIDLKTLRGPDAGLSPIELFTEFDEANPDTPIQYLEHGATCLCFYVVTLQPRAVAGPDLTGLTPFQAMKARQQWARDNPYDPKQDED